MVLVFLVLVIVTAAGLAIWLRPWPLFSEVKTAVSMTNRNVATEFPVWVERKARALGLNVHGVARPIPLECPRCRKTSNYFVYPDELCERCWSAQLKAQSPHVSENHL